MGADPPLVGRELWILSKFMCEMVEETLLTDSITREKVSLKDLYMLSCVWSTSVIPPGVVLQPFRIVSSHIAKCTNSAKCCCVMWEKIEWRIRSCLMCQCYKLWDLVADTGGFSTACFRCVENHCCLIVICIYETSLFKLIKLAIFYSHLRNLWCFFT